MTKDELLRQERKARLASTKVVAYDTVTVAPKPVSLMPNENAGLNYFGPPPDQGTSYGEYACACGMACACNRGMEMHCPACGDVMNETGEIGTPDATYDSLGTCGACQTACVTDMKQAGESDPYCPQCGSRLNMSAQSESEDSDEEDEDNNGEDSDAPEEAPEDSTPEEEEEGDDMSSTSKYIPIVKYDALKSKESGNSSIDMLLFAEGSHQAAPFWSVWVDGQPVAKVALANQPKPEEFSDMFLSDNYKQDVIKAMHNIGVAPILDTIGAEYYANEVDKTEIATNIAQKLSAAAEEDKKLAVATLTEKLLSHMEIALAGANKNFFKDFDNGLKESFYDVLVSEGVREPVKVIEAAIDKGGMPFFKEVIAKAIELMDMTPEAVNEIAAAVGNANTITPITASNPIEDSYANQLAQANVAIAASQSLSVNATDSKSELKNLFSFSKDNK